MEIIKKDFNNRIGNKSFKLCAITILFFAYPLTALSNLKQYITCIVDFPEKSVDYYRAQRM